MKMTKSKEQQIYVQIDNERIELTGAEKETFILGSTFAAISFASISSI